MTHFNWLQLLPFVGHDYVHIAVFVVVGIVAVLLALVGRWALGGAETAYVPAGGVSVKGLFEALMDFIVDLANNVLGEDGKKYAPYAFTLFFVIALNNILGMLPGFSPATDNLNTTLSMGLCVFLVYNYLGFKENGVGYLKHFAGPVLVLAPLMFMIELISHAVRPLSLGLRLQANMQGDHMVVSAFTGLVPYLVPVPFYWLGMFVSLMQAFVFTLLTMIYISLATAHDH